MIGEPVDGFVDSASQLYLPTSYRASALTQMEVLRRARGYRTRWYIVPEELQQTIPAFSQVEFQVAMQPGSYVWGVVFNGRNMEDSEAKKIFVQVTDACTETPFFSDYCRGNDFRPVQGANIQHGPTLIMPRLIGEPGTVNVELYNSNDQDEVCQFVLFVAEPTIPPQPMIEALEQMGVLAAISLNS